MWLRRALGISLVLLIGACDGGGAEVAVPVRSPAASPAMREGPVIGLVGTMSGPGAWRGEDAFEGADLAVQLLNRAGRGPALPYQLVTLDDRGEPGRATDLVEELASDRRTVGVVYAGPPSAIAPAADALRAAGIPAAICYGDLYSARLLRSHLFQMAAPLVWQARRHAAYIARDRGYRQIGLIAQSGLDGDTAVEAARIALRRQGRRLAVVRRVDADDDLDAVLDDMERRRTEVLLVKGSPSTLGEIAELLRERGSLYRTTAAARTITAPRRIRQRERRTGERRRWRPHLMGFDLAISPESGRLPPGTIASDSYARGTYLLPVPSFERFHDAFTDWWGSEPTGWEHRAFDAASMIGWAARRTPPGEDIAEVLEGMDRVRFGTLDISFDPGDRVAVEERAVGLWVIPRSGLDVRAGTRRPDGMRWVMLARGFSSNGRRTDIPPADWPHLFRRPASGGRSPRIGAARFAVSTPRRDPVH